MKMVEKKNKYHTITIFREDFEFLDQARISSLGKVSYADIVKKVCEVYKQVID